MKKYVYTTTTTYLIKGVPITFHGYWFVAILMEAYVSFLCGKETITQLKQLNASFNISEQKTGICTTDVRSGRE